MDPAAQKEAVLQQQAEARLKKKEEEDANPPAPTAPVEAAAPPAALRENMVSNAVKFLSHETVTNSPLVRKVAYLESKGLTNEEIQEAIRRVGGNPATAAAPLAPIAATTAPALPARVEYIVAPPPPPPQSSTFRTVATSIVLTLGAVGGGAWLFNSFLRPALKERQGQPQQAMQMAQVTPVTPVTPVTSSPVVEQGNAALQQSMSELVAVMKTQQTEVKDTLKMVHTVLSTPEKVAPKPALGDQVNVSQLTNAITELHSLLKSGNLNSPASSPAPAFPAPESTPTTGPNSSYFSSDAPSPVTTPMKATAPAAAAEETPTGSRSFADVMRMVQAGEPMPNVKQIDDSPADPTAQVTPSTTEKPLKPWEKRRQARTSQTASSPRETPAYLKTVRSPVVKKSIEELLESEDSAAPVEETKKEEPVEETQEIQADLIAPQSPVEEPIEEEAPKVEEKAPKVEEEAPKVEEI